MALLSLSLISPLALSNSTHPEIIKERQKCLVCHGMKTMAYRDPLTHQVVSLYVDGDQMAVSNHANLSCSHCHTSGYKQFPHREKAQRIALEGILYCTDCHHDNKAFPQAQFEKIEEEFKQSVHFQKQPYQFDCFTCHNPHDFRRAAKIDTLDEKIDQTNTICLNCHQQEINKGISHNWLPNLQLHWQSVRCIDCHTPIFQESVHHIIKPERSKQYCEACHHKDSQLISKLYKHSVIEERQKAGFINSLVMNEAYIIGMTRNKYLDWLALIIIVGTAAGLFVHAFARWIMRRRINTKKQIK